MVLLKIPCKSIPLSLFCMAIVECHCGLSPIQLGLCIKSGPTFSNQVITTDIISTLQKAIATNKYINQHKQIYRFVVPINISIDGILHETANNEIK